MVIERAVQVLRFVAGPASLLLIVAGMWGLYGWEVGLIALGLPPSAFYVIGEYRKLKEPV